MARVTPAAVAREALTLLRARADPRRARGVQAYFKESVRAFGVTAPQVREIAARLHRQVKRAPRTAGCDGRRSSRCSGSPAGREHKAAVYAMARRHFDSSDDLVQKAAGWLLREAGKQDMRALEAFLRVHGPRIPRTTVRYAIERFAPARRRALLLSTSPLPLSPRAATRQR